MKIEAISTKQVDTKRGKADTYAFKGDDGQWYSTGFDNPGVAKGDEVDFEFENTRYGNKVKFETFKINGAAVKGKSTGPAKAPYVPRAVGTGGSAPTYTKPFPIPLLHGDRAIIRQNALTNARELYDSDPEKPIKDAAKEIIEVARIFEEYSAGDGERREAESKSKEAK